MLGGRTEKPPIDRGWAWVVLLATFLLNALASTTYVSGIYNIVFLEAFDQSVVLTALCCSLHSSIMALIGPLTAFLIKTVGARLTALAGATLVFIGYLVPSFVPTFPVVFVFYGLCAGCGLGLAYLPFMVWMGFHFKRHRNLAFGLVTTGGGMGGFVFAPLVHFLIQKYGWQGSMTIMAGITAHLFIAASLLRPIDFDTDATEDLAANEANHTNTTVDENGKAQGKFQGSIHNSSNDCLPQTNQLHEEEASGKISQHCTPKRKETLTNTTSQKIDQSFVAVALSQPDLYKSSVQASRFNFHFSSDNVHGELKKESADPLQEPQKALHRDLLVNKSVHVKYTTKHIHQISSEVITRSMISLNNPWVMYDNKTNIHYKTEKKTELAKVAGKWKTFLEDYRYLCNRKFLLFCANQFFIHIGLGMAYIYLPALARANSSTDFQVAQLLSLIGITNICSRLLTGMATNSENINTYVVHIGTCGITGFVFFLTPILSSYYIGQVGLAVCFGLYGIVFPVMMAPITIDIVGISSLNVAYGIELLLCGLGMLIGPPLGGLVYEILGSFDYVMVLAGVCYFVGALIMMLIPITST